MGHSCIIFKIKFLSLKQILLLLEVFYFLYKFSYCLHSSSPRLVYLGKQVFEKYCLEQNENFLKPLGDEKNHGGNADWEEYLKTWWVNCVTHKCTSQYLNKNLKISPNHGWITDLTKNSTHIQTRDRNLRSFFKYEKIYPWG